MTESETWPAADRRRPARSAPSYPMLAPLSAWISENARRAADRYGAYRVLDVGCGAKPYYPFFEHFVREYVGVDVANPNADLEGTAEELPVPDASFDLVLCTQVLEHTTDPDRAVRELYRVTAHGGRVLASTHGVMPWHPSPEDHWRWTHTGLERLFARNGAWAFIGVTPACGTAATVGVLVSYYVHLLARRYRIEAASGPAVRAIHAVSAAIDRHVPLLREPQPGTLVVNYHVLAERGS